MGIKANYKIKNVSKTDFLNKIGIERDSIIKPTTKGGVFEVIYSFGEKFAADLANKLNAMNDVDTGSLIDSFNFKIKQFGVRYEFTFNLKDYYKYLDQGRKAGGKQPWDKSKGLDKTGQGNVIYQWVKRNNYMLPSKDGKSIKDKVKNQLALTWLINRRIKKYGIKGNKFFSTTTKDGRIQQLTKDLSTALGKDVIVDIKEFVKELKK